MQAVIDKGFHSQAPWDFLKSDTPVIQALYFIRYLQRSNGDMLDSRDDNYGDDQNISLHELVSQLSMRRLCTSRKVTVNNRRLSTPIDAGFCPFCKYHSSCHKTLNNHVRIHLSLSLFCGIWRLFLCHQRLQGPDSICRHGTSVLQEVEGAQYQERKLWVAPELRSSLVPSGSPVTSNTTKSITVIGNPTGVDED